MRIIWNLWRDISDPNAGGAEVYEHEVLERLSRRGHSVTAIVGGNHRLSDQARSYRVVSNGGIYSQYVRAPLTRRSVLDEPADVIVDSSNGMTFFSPVTTRIPTVLLVHHVHVQQWNDYFKMPIAQVGRFMERRVMPRIYRRNRVIAVSESTAADLRDLGIPGPNIAVVCAGAESDVAPVAEAPEPQFLALGRLVPNKRLHLLLDMWQRVQPIIGGTLTIAGRGPEFDSLRSRVIPGVEICGRVADGAKEQLLGSSWFLVHAAKHEGWGLVINEAAAHARPTLGFDVPGVRDAIQDGVTGILTSDADEFVKEWIALASDPGQRRRLGNAARDRAGAMSWDACADQVEAVLHQATTDRALGTLQP